MCGGFIVGAAERVGRALDASSSFFAVDCSSFERFGPFFSTGEFFGVAGGGGDASGGEAFVQPKFVAADRARAALFRVA